MYPPALVARLCLALLCLSPLNLAHAAPTPGETDLIRERQDRLLEEQRRRLEELKELPGKEAKPMPPTAPADARCFPIKDIELKGADSLSDSDKNRLLKPYIGQCLGVTQLNELLKVITDHYIEKGLVTSRAYLPQQDLSKRGRIYLFAAVQWPKYKSVPFFSSPFFLMRIMVLGIGQEARVTKERLLIRPIFRKV